MRENNKCLNELPVPEIVYVKKKRSHDYNFGVSYRENLEKGKGSKTIKNFSKRY